MASIGRLIAQGVAVRNAGFTSENLKYGGIYHPAHTNLEGKAVPARWESSFIKNAKGWVDGAGQKQEGRMTVIHVTAWSGKQANGNGFAEKLARIMSLGLEASFEMEVDSYDWKQYDNGNLVCRADGTPILVRNKIGFTIQPGTLIIGNEGDKHIKNEVMKYQASNGMTGRPQQWNNMAHPDFNIWREMNIRRNGEMYQQGAKTFGYSIVQIARGAQAAVYGNAGVGAGAGINSAMVAAATGALVDGFTIDRWRASGLTDDIMLANPKFAPYHSTIMLARGTTETGAGAGMPSPEAVAAASLPDMNAINLAMNLPTSENDQALAAIATSAF